MSTSRYRLNPVYKLAQMSVLLEIAARPGVTQKRTNNSQRYYGVGICIPEAMTESTKMIEELKEQRAAQCRKYEEDINSWDNLIFREITLHALHYYTAVVRS